MRGTHHTPKAAPCAGSCYHTQSPLQGQPSLCIHLTYMYMYIEVEYLLAAGESDHEAKSAG